MGLCRIQVPELGRFWGVVQQPAYETLEFRAEGFRVALPLHSLYTWSTIDSQRYCRRDSREVQTPTCNSPKILNPGWDLGFRAAQPHEPQRRIVLDHLSHGTIDLNGKMRNLVP